jgi:hypothetical protein
MTGVDTIEFSMEMYSIKECLNKYVKYLYPESCLIHAEHADWHESVA